MNHKPKIIVKPSPGNYLCMCDDEMKKEYDLFEIELVLNDGLHSITFRLCPDCIFDLMKKYNKAMNTADEIKIEYPKPSEIIKYTENRCDELVKCRAEDMISKIIALELDMIVANRAIEYFNKKYGEQVEL